MKILTKRAINGKFADDHLFIANVKIKYLKQLASLFVVLTLMPSNKLFKPNERNAVFYIKPFNHLLIRDADDPNKIGTSCTSVKVKLAIRNLDKNKESNCKIKVDVLTELKESIEAGIGLNKIFPHISTMKFTAEKVENGLATIMRLQNSLFRYDYFRSQSDCENTLKEYYRQVNLPSCKFESKDLDDVPND